MVHRPRSIVHLPFLCKSQRISAGHQEEQGGEDEHHEIGAEEQQLFAHGDEGECDTAQADQQSANSNPKEPFRSSFGDKRSNKDDQACHAVEERNSDLLESIHAADAGDGDGKEADRGEPFEICLPGRKVFLSQPHRYTQRDQAGNGQHVGRSEDAHAEEDQQKPGNQKHGKAHQIIQVMKRFVHLIAVKKIPAQVRGDQAGGQKKGNIFHDILLGGKGWGEIGYRPVCELLHNHFLVFCN